MRWEKVNGEWVAVPDRSVTQDVGVVVRTCSKCRRPGGPDAFYRNEASPDGLSSRCRDCCRAAANARKRSLAGAYVAPQSLPVRHHHQGRGPTADGRARDRRDQEAALVGAELAKAYRALHAWWVEAGYGTAEGGAAGPAANRAVAAVSMAAERIREMRRSKHPALGPPN